MTAPDPRAELAADLLTEEFRLHPAQRARAAQTIEAEYRPLVEASAQMENALKNAEGLVQFVADDYEDGGTEKSARNILHSIMTARATYRRALGHAAVAPETDAENGQQMDELLDDITEAHE